LQTADQHDRKWRPRSGFDTQGIDALTVSGKAYVDKFSGASTSQR
jgi:hypothetical protein